MTAAVRRVFLCADIGTSSLKAALIDADGTPLAFAREAYPADRVLNGAVLADDWEAAFRRAVSVLTNGDASATSDRRLRIDAICLSGNGPTLVPLYRDGSSGAPLHWHDGRTDPAPTVSLPISTNPTTSPATARSLFLPRASWLKTNQISNYLHLRYFMSSHEWLAYRLGAEPVAALPTPEYAEYYWDRPQLASYGLDPAYFPPFVALGDRIGKLSSAAADGLGLPAGLPIIAGGPDFIMALIGAGALREGMVCDRAGTSEGINVCAAKPSKSAELRSLPHPAAGLWNVAALLPITGRLFDWFRSITGQGERGYDAIMADINAATGEASVRGLPGDGYFFPDLKAVGGLGAASAFLATAGFTTPAQLGRAVVEAIAFMVRNAVDSLERHGYRIEGMRLSGGQAKNGLWNRMKADITGRCLLVPRIADGELAGNAAAVLLALGEADTLEEASDRIVRIETTYEPDQKRYARYSERYDDYRAMLHKMAQFFP